MSLARWLIHVLSRVRKIQCTIYVLVRAGVLEIDIYMRTLETTEHVFSFHRLCRPVSQRQHHLRVSPPVSQRHLRVSPPVSQRHQLVLLQQLHSRPHSPVESRLLSQRVLLRFRLRNPLHCPVQSRLLGPLQCQLQRLPVCQHHQRVSLLENQLRYTME